MTPSSFQNSAKVSSRWKHGHTNTTHNKALGRYVSHHTRTFMNVATVEFELAEASHHLQRLVAELRDGKIGDRGEPAVAVQLGHVLDHLCRAWNCKDMTPEQSSSLSQAEFDRLSNTVPNFMGERVIGEFAL